jgi:exonuclease VII small subunit
LAVKAARGDGKAVRELLEKLVGELDGVKGRLEGARRALDEADALLAGGCESLPEAKLEVRTARAHLSEAAEWLAELAATIDAALALAELAESAQPASQGGGGS